MNNPLVRSLQHHRRLAPEDQLELERISIERKIRLSHRQIVAAEGDASRYLHVVLSGWACRYKELPNGKRQITAFCLPGDICDERILSLPAMDHSFAVLTPAVLGLIDAATIAELTTNHPRVRDALFGYWQTQTAIQREWILSLGQRGAPERMAHLFCELHMRLRLVGLADAGSCEMPLTQTELGEATGLSTVHVNRVLQELRSTGLIALRGRMLTIPSLHALRDAAMFDPTYLRNAREEHRVDADS